MSLLTSALRATIRSLVASSTFTTFQRHYNGFNNGFNMRRRHDPFSAQVNLARSFKPRLRQDEFHRRMFMCRGIEG